jgi:hypothetical protein
LDGTPFISLDTTATYSVPSGKNLYVTSLFNYVIDPNGNLLNYSNGIIFPDFNNFSQSIGGNETSYPILPSGTNIKCTCTGILLDNSPFITPFLFFWENGISNSYTVPLNKKLILKSGYFGQTILKINGIEVGFHQTSVADILVLAGGTVLSNSTFLTGNRLFTGYLID